MHLEVYTLKGKSESNKHRITRNRLVCLNTEGSLTILYNIYRKDKQKKNRTNQFLSINLDEKEFLFIFGSIFRIVSVRSDKNGFWIIKLNLCGGYNCNLKKICDQMKVGTDDGKLDLIWLGNCDGIVRVAAYAFQYFPLLQTSYIAERTVTHDITRIKRERERVSARWIGHAGEA
jgi:hypothetical protein